MNRTTELEAINMMLSVIGESPVLTVDEELSVDAHIARNILTEQTRDVLMDAWEFNTETKTLTPDDEDRIYVPSYYLAIQHAWSESYYTNRYSQRGELLYDLENNTFDITESVEVTAIVGFDFEEIPEPVRRYIAVRAARFFQDRRLMDRDLHMYTMTDEIEAKAKAVEFDSRDGEYMMTESEDISQILIRRGRPYFPNG